MTWNDTMVKIGIDARLYSHTGVGTYLRNLLFYLEKKVTNTVFFYIYLLDENYPTVHFKSSQFIKRAVSSRWHSFSEQIWFAKKIYEDRLDLMHFTYFSYPVLYRKKFIATIHDVTPLFYKTGRASMKNPLTYEIKHQVFKFVIAEQVKNAHAIITPTKAVKKDLEKIYGQNYSKKIYPIYEGIDYELINPNFPALPASQQGEPAGRQFPVFKQITGLKSKMEDDSFFIYVGNFYPHKNVERLIKAFARIKERMKLILIGPADFFSTYLLRLINELGQKDRILFFHNPKREELVYFYKNALALVHPSLSEGFGLPIIEASYFKTPIIASDIDVFKELLKDKYISFNPLDEDDMQKKMEFFLERKLKIHSAHILDKFSFEKMTEETFSLYKSSL